MRLIFTVMSCIVLAASVLVSCGSNDSRSPTRSPDHTGPDSVTIPPSSGTPIAGAPSTVGELADQIGAAWIGVQSFRTTFTVRTDADLATPAPDANQPPRSLAMPTIRDSVILPDRRHRVIVIDQTQVLEVIAVSGRVFVRGSLSQSYAPDHTDPTSWIELDATTIAIPNQLGINLADVVQPVPAPYSALPADVRERVLTPAGGVEIGNRRCQAYRATDMTSTGESITVTISLGADNLPCSIETRAGGTISLTTYDAYNEPLSISPPPDATPVASPAA